MNNWVTADMHLFHKTASNKRAFDSVFDMNDFLIERWNDRIKPMDTVWHLGDMTLGGKLALIGVISKLNGQINIIPGGHDKRWMKSFNFGIASGVYEYPAQYHLMGILHKLPIVLNHWAMRTWHMSHYGSIHLYGHSHGSLEGLGKSMDVGVKYFLGWKFKDINNKELVFDNGRERTDILIGAVKNIMVFSG